MHTVVGGSNFALSNSFDDMRASECTSCLVKQDKSAYWAPSLYFLFSNGSVSSVSSGLLIYYRASPPSTVSGAPRTSPPARTDVGSLPAVPRFNAADKTNVTAFPDGLRMLAGNPFKRSYDGSEAAQAIGWNCLGANVAQTCVQSPPLDASCTADVVLHLATGASRPSPTTTARTACAARSGSRPAGTASTSTRPTTAATSHTPSAASLDVRAFLHVLQSRARS